METTNEETYDLHIVQTGGTIDKDYPKRVGGYAFEIGAPATDRVLQRVQPAFTYRQVTVCQKDSQDITDSDREALRAAVLASPTRRVLITHGTDTLLNTARFLATRGLHGRRVMLTGAHLPETFRNSDADFNVGVAVGALMVDGGEGVFVAMSGRVSSWDKVMREEPSGKFISK